MQVNVVHLPRGIAFKFDHKPREAIRSALKANKFRWSPSSGTWWRDRAGEWADLLQWIRDNLESDSSANRQPVGACWECKDPNGYFRIRAAASPVYCDSCHARHVEEEREEQQRRLAADDFDLANNRCM